VLVEKAFQGLGVSVQKLRFGDREFEGARCLGNMV
jgi:hypothetical protein